MGIAISLLDGLMYGAGDAVIGINPASDDVGALIRLWHALDEVRERFDIPDADLRADARHQRRSPRSNAARRSTWCSSRSPARRSANESFGITLAMLGEALRRRALVIEARDAGRSRRPPTSCTSRPGRAARCRPARITASTSRRARRAPTRVAQSLPIRCVTNSVVGFIGPEYLHDGKQIIRAGLEDHFCGKLMGAADRLRRLLHEPCGGRLGRHGHADDAAR